MSVDGAWLGDPESTPCEMGGGALVDYNQARQGQLTAHLYVTKAAFNARLECIAQLVESGAPWSSYAAQRLAIRIRGMKERPL